MGDPLSEFKRHSKFASQSDKKPSILEVFMMNKCPFEKFVMESQKMKEESSKKEISSNNSLPKLKSLQSLVISQSHSSDFGKQSNILETSILVPEGSEVVKKKSVPEPEEDQLAKKIAFKAFKARNLRPQLQPIMKELVRKEKNEKKVYLNKNMEHSLQLINSRSQNQYTTPRSEGSLIVSKENYIKNLSFNNKTRLNDEMQFKQTVALLRKRLEKDDLINFLLPLKEEHKFHMQVVVCTCLIGKPNFYSYEDIRKKHREMNLRNIHFDHLKNHALSSLRTVNTEEDKIQKGMLYLENFRNAIVEDSAFLSKMRHPELLKDIVTDFYERLTVDEILKPFFLHVDMRRQVEFVTNFLKMLFGITDPDMRVLKTDLRKLHENMGLNDVHYFIYKSHMGKCLRQQGCTEKEIEKYLLKIELKREPILNRDTTYEEIVRKKGMKVWQEFVKDFIHLTERCHPIRSLFKNDDITIQFAKHQEIMLDYFLNTHGIVSQKDIRIQHSKCGIKPEVFQEMWKIMAKLLQEKFYFNNEKTKKIYEKFIYPARNIVTNTPTILKKICSYAENLKMSRNEFLDKIRNSFGSKIFSHAKISSHFISNDFDHYTHINKMMGLLYNDKDFYNDQDIRNAHSSLDISNNVFSTFVMDWHETLKAFKFPDNLIEEAITIMESKRHLITKSKKI